MWLKIILMTMFGFSGSLTSTFDIRGIVSGDRMASVPLGISLGAGELDVEGICTVPGMACQNCSLAVTCVPLPSGWLKLPLEECSAGYTCNAHLGKCSIEPVPECDARSRAFEHSCEQVGIYPDAIDCRKFHLCSPPEGLPDGRPAEHRTALCPRHYGYNPRTAQCSVPLMHGQCMVKVTPDCAVVGEFGVLPSSPNHYYVCLSKGGVMFPQIFICPNGWYFNNGYCNPEPVQEGNKMESVEIEAKTTESVNGFKNSDVAKATETLVNNFLSEPESTESSTRSRIDSFFSTEKAASYPADTFLADKFDLTNYESTDDVAQTNNDYPNHYDDWNTFEK